jgi:carboxypeptidase C (cathepsin A)
MDGALMEVGPYRLKDNQTLEYNEGSWDEFANLLFVDQPVGTGFSFANTNSYLRELDEMAAQFVTFMEKWFDLFPEYERDDVGTSTKCPLIVALMLIYITTDLFGWRILCRPIYPIHC